MTVKNLAIEKQKKEERGLGKGLAALLGDYQLSPEHTEKEAFNNAILVPVDQLRPGVYQPRNRDRINDESLMPLRESIRLHGVLQPILAREVSPGDYEIIAGERRWSASKKENLQKIPVILKALSHNECLEIALIENLQRDDLTALEEADSFHKLMNEFEYTQLKLSQMLGVSRSYIANSLRLRTLPKSVMTALEQNQISVGHARALITAKEPDILLKKIIQNGLNVRQIEALVKGEQSVKPNKKLIKKTKHIVSLENEIAKKLNRKVRIQMVGKAAGKCEIKFDSLDELEEFLEQIK